MTQTLFLVAANIILLAINLLVAEYDIAKLAHPLASWLPTNPWLDLTIIGFVCAGTFFNLAVLGFVIHRRLWQHLTWLKWTTLASLIGTGILAFILGSLFLPILWPY